MLFDTGRAPGLRKCWSLAFAMAFLLSGPAQSQTAPTEIRGTPEVIDADILKFGTQRVLLWGVDAPDTTQTCRQNDAPWNCHDVAFRKLQLLAGRGEVVCTFHGAPDPFGRRFGICESGGDDLNAEMIKAGVALAFAEETDTYLPEMAEAIGAGVGLWQPGVEFEEPWVFRRRETPGGYR
jgi:endonuclease YncB( thermonuclease family)